MDQETKNITFYDDRTKTRNFLLLSLGVVSYTHRYLCTYMCMKYVWKYLRPASTSPLALEVGFLSIFIVSNKYYSSRNFLWLRPSCTYVGPPAGTDKRVTEKIKCQK
jgi:hypothetical protein